jgi:DivIVA domain-containing protein
VKWFILVVGLVVVCFVVALLLGLVSGGMGAPTSSMRHEPLPDTPLTEEDLDSLQLDVTARGYRMSEVDAVISRLRRELREKDEQIAVLTADVTGERQPIAPAPAASPPADGEPTDSLGGEPPDA